VALIAVAIAGCAAGPDYRAPTAPEAARFTATPMPVATLGGDSASDRAQGFADPAAAPANWWSLLGSAELDALVARALKHSPTLAASEAALRQAQELAAAQRGAFLPSLAASYSPLRARIPNTQSSPLSSGASLYTLHTAQLSVGYVADVFGGNRRAVEALQAQGDAQAWQLRAAQLTLAANVAAAALQEASLRAQLAAGERLSAMAERQLALLQVQRRLGAAPGAAVLAQEALWRQTQATVAGLKKQLAQQRDLLAVLVGDLPANLVAPAFELSALTLPDVPNGLPAGLLAQRPDVRVAEAQLHAANAGVGVAVANMLPQITLTANYGSSAQELGQLFRAGGLLWSVGANVAQPLFEGGALLHRKRAAQAQLDQALAQYQSTVLSAFQNVADTLEAVRYDAEQYVAAQRQEAAALAALRIAQKQLELGDISVLTLLNAETTYRQASLARIQAQAARFSDVVAMYQALGGSWGDGRQGPIGDSLKGGPTGNATDAGVP
jgi:NodT family efflux transporter outer membrane factor (OMF) lipoprotein